MFLCKQILNNQNPTIHEHIKVHCSFLNLEIKRKYKNQRHNYDMLILCKMVLLMHDQM